MPHIATDDIGSIAAWSFNHLDQSIGRIWEIVGQITTFSYIAESFSKIFARPFIFAAPPPAEDIRFFAAVLQSYRLDPSWREVKFGFKMTSFQEFLTGLDFSP